MQLEDSAMRLEGFKKSAIEWQERFTAERNVRRKLHEQMQVLRGNIRVMCRSVMRTQHGFLACYPVAFHHYDLWLQFDVGMILKVAASDSRDQPSCQQLLFSTILLISHHLSAPFVL